MRSVRRDALGAYVARRVPAARLKKPLSGRRFGDLPAFRAGVRTENVETPEQRVAAVEQQELQQEQDEGRSDQVLELFVELLEAEGRQVAFSILLIVRTISSSPIDWLVERM